MAFDAGKFAGGRLFIDLDALIANHRALSALVAPAVCAAVVKADAYGLGVLPVSRALSQAGCSTFFVAHLAEGLELRPELPADARIFILNGLPAGAEAACADAGLIPVLNSITQALDWADFAQGRNEKLPAALQADSGMSRLGMAHADLQRLAADPLFTANVDLRLFMSHLACADHAGAQANEDQRRAFEAAAALFPGVPRSLANSGGAFLGAAFHGDVARCGIAQYGGTASDLPGGTLAPVVRLQARVVQTRTVMLGTGVGYGLDFRADAPTRIATLGVGYADGWSRALGGGRGCAWFEGVRLPIAGRVSMDSMTIDLGALEEGVLVEGDWVDLIVGDHGIDDVATAAGTISYEILTSLGRRYERNYLGGNGGEAR